MSFFRLTPSLLIIPALASSIVLAPIQPSLAASLLPDALSTVDSLLDINFNSLLLQEDETQFVLNILVQGAPLQKYQSSVSRQTSSRPSIRMDKANNLSLDFWVQRLKQIRWFSETNSSLPIKVLPRTLDPDVNEGVYTFKASKNSSRSAQNSSSSKFNNPFQQKSSLFSNPFLETKDSLANSSLFNSQQTASQQTAIDNPFAESYTESNDITNNPVLNSAQVFDNLFLQVTTGVDNTLATQTESFKFSENTSSTGAINILANNFLQPIRAARALKNRPEITTFGERISLAAKAKFKKTEPSDISSSLNNAFSKARKNVQFALVPDKYGLKTTLGVAYQIGLSQLVGQVDGAYLLALKTELPLLPTPMAITEKSISLSNFGASKLTEVTNLAGYGMNERVRRKIRQDQKEALEKVANQEKLRYQRLLTASRSTLSQIQNPVSAASIYQPSFNNSVPAATLPSQLSLSAPSSVPKPLRTTPRDFY
jgi:hypothetical protein